MRETKKRLELFSFYDYSAIQNHLEKMAKQGWRLMSAGTRGLWTYRKAEPAALHYAVVYFPDSSQFDPGPTEGQQTLRDYCLAAEWEPVADWGQMQIYMTDRPDPVPIDTEPALQLETVHRTMKRTLLPGQLALLAIFLLQLPMQLTDLYWTPADYLSGGNRLSSLLVLLLGLALTAVELGGYFLWRRRCKDSIARGGGCVPSRGHSKLTWALLGLMVLAAVCVASLGNAATGAFMVLYLVGFLLIFCLTWRLQTALKRRKFSRAANRAVTMGAVVVLTVVMMAGLMAGLFMTLRAGITDRPPAETYQAHGMTWDVYHDPIPLRVEELMAVDYDGWSTSLNVHATPLVTLEEAVQEPRLGDGNLPELSYEIADVHVPFLQGLVLNGYLRESLRYDRDLPEDLRRAYRPMDPALWNADEAYQRYQDGESENLYLLRWGTRIVRIRFHGLWTLTAAQMATVAESLSPT